MNFELWTYWHIELPFGLADDAEDSGMLLEGADDCLKDQQRLAPNSWHNKYFLAEIRSCVILCG